MNFASSSSRFVRALAALAMALPLLANAADPNKKEIVFGATAGPYADQIRYGIAPILEKEGYKVRVVEFNDYIQPNFALAEGSLDANAFQHEVYLKKFATEKNLAISEVVKVPTAPIAMYSHKHTSLADVKDGATIALPNDPTNLARALVVLDRKLGWLGLKAGYDPIRTSEHDVVSNPKHLKLVLLEAAQLPRSLDDTDFSFINGNFAIASGLKISDALVLEDTTPTYQNVVAVRSADRDLPYVKDIVAAYKSREFLDVTNRRFPGFVKTADQLKLEQLRAER